VQFGACLKESAPQSSFTGTLRPSTTSENLKDTVKETQGYAINDKRLEALDRRSK